MTATAIARPSPTAVGDGTRQAAGVTVSSAEEKERQCEDNVHDQAGDGVESDCGDADCGRDPLLLEVPDVGGDATDSGRGDVGWRTMTPTGRLGPV